VWIVKEFLATVNEQLKECLKAFTCPVAGSSAASAARGSWSSSRSLARNRGHLFLLSARRHLVSRWTEPAAVPSVLVALSELGHAALALRRALGKAVFGHFQRA